MQINNVASQIKDLIDKSKKILVVTRENPTMDGIYSVLAIDKYLALVGKQALLVSGDFTRDPEVDQAKIAKDLPVRNLIISFDYVEGSIEKVSYNVEGNKFNLVITPKTNSITPDQINYSYSGDSFDLIISVDIPQLSLIAKSVNNIEHEFHDVPIINIDHTQINTLYGQINYVDPDKASTSEILLELFTNLKKLDAPICKLLYLGIKNATQNFNLSVKSTTLVSAANCLKVIETDTPSSEQTANDQPESAGSSESNTTDKNNLEVNDSTKKAAESVEEQKEQPKAETVPDSSWYVPKIFRSSQSDN